LGCTRDGGEEGGGVDGVGDGEEVGVAGADDGHWAEFRGGEDERSCHHRIVGDCSHETVASALKMLEGRAVGRNKLGVAGKYPLYMVYRRRVGRESGWIR